MEGNGAAAAAAAAMVVKNGTPGRLTDSVDRFLNSSPAFAASLRQAFLQLAVSTTPQQPPLPGAVNAGSSLVLPAASLLPALNSLQQKLTEGMDPKLWRLSLRKFTYCDMQALVEQNSSFNPYTSIEFKDFEWAARQAFKNIALEKSRRVGLYVLGGMVAVHLAHGMVRKVPYIGKHMGFLVRVLSPTPIMGPLLGLAGASCCEEKILRQMLPL